MGRVDHRVLLALSAVLVVNCGRSEEGGNTCQSNEDCPDRHICVALEYGSYCVRQDGHGEGGVGGDGGSGGLGGTEGNLEPLFAMVDLQLLADDELAAYLDAHGRKVDAVVVRHATSAGEREIVVPLAEPTTIPLGPVEVRLPLHSRVEEQRLQLEARGVRSDESLAPLAIGEVDVKLEAYRRLTAVAVLSFVPEFDWDTDGDPDLSDCGPDDPAVHHGAYDICDGERQACGQSFCYIPLGAGETVLDLDCGTIERTCAVAIQGPERKFLRVYSSGTPGLLTEVRYKADWVGLTANPLGDKDYFVVISSQWIDWFDASGTFVNYSSRNVPAGLSGVVAAFDAGSMPKVVAGLRDRVGIVLLEPQRLDFMNECDTEGSDCRMYLLEDLLYEADGDRPRRITDLAVFRSGPPEVLEMYFTATDEPRIGLLRLSSRRDYGVALLEPPPGAVANRFLEPLRNPEYVFVSYLDESSSPRAAVLRRTGTFGHVAYERQVLLPPGACPSAIDPGRSMFSLWMADDCTGSLWELPLDAQGLPSSGKPVQHQLERCAEPFVMASVPVSVDGSAATFVGCRGENHILVLGRS